MGAVWNVLTLEQLRQLSDEQVAQRANESLVPLGAPTQGLYIQPADFLAAQYYVNELERREKRRADEARDAIDTRRWEIDLRYERLIVVLIILEVILAAALTWWTDDRQSKSAQKELEALQSVQQVLSHLEESSKDTAAAIKEERQTMEAMNTALQRQLALFYDVSLNVLFDQDRKKLMLTNNGRTNIVFWGGKIGDTNAFVPEEGRTITAGAGFEFDISPTYESMIARFPKPAQGMIPYELYIKNERGEEFVQHGYFSLVWKNDVGILNVQTISVAPEHWSAAKGVKPAAGKAPGVQ